MIATVTQQPIIKILATQAEVSAVRAALLRRVAEMERTGEAEGKKGTAPADDYETLNGVLKSLELVWNDTRLYKMV